MNETDSVFFVTKLKVSTAEITFKLESPSRILEMFLLSESSLFDWLSIKNWTVNVIIRTSNIYMDRKLDDDDVVDDDRLGEMRRLFQIFSINECQHKLQFAFNRFRGFSFYQTLSQYTLFSEAL